MLPHPHLIHIKNLIIHQRIDGHKIENLLETAQETLRRLNEPSLEPGSQKDASQLFGE